MPAATERRLLQSTMHPWLGSVISRRRAWVLLDQRRWEAGVSRRSCPHHAWCAGISPVLGSSMRSLRMEVSQAVLCGAALGVAGLYTRLENTREEEGGCKETSSLPLKPPVDTYPQGGPARGWTRAAYGSGENPGEGCDKGADKGLLEVHGCHRESTMSRLEQWSSCMSLLAPWACSFVLCGPRCIMACCRQRRQQGS